MMRKSVIQLVPEDNKEPIPVKIIEDSIVAIAEAMRAINGTRLTRKALVVLINHHSKVPQRYIELVLNNLECLEQTWLKKKMA